MLSDTDDTTAAAGTDTPAQTVEPAEAPLAAQPVQGAQTVSTAEAPPPASSHRTTGWFSRGWRYGAAAAVIVVVAGAFFTIGWFTSAHDGHDHAIKAKEVSRQMDLREWGFQQGRADRQDSDQWHGQRCPQVQSQPNGQSGQQTPSSQRGYLGVGVETVTPGLQQQYSLTRADGALVASIDRTGPAFQAGIRRGDIITGIDGTSVTTQDDVINLVGQKNPGDSVSVAVDRDGQSLTFQVTLAARPDAISG
jgi:membrane-associated protease RseP (regulator of RpoE activity)